MVVRERDPSNLPNVTADSRNSMSDADSLNGMYGM